MTPEEYQWHINLVKDRYHALDLTFEQAKKIFEYEQDKNTYSEKHFFSQWEEWDYELVTFKEILDAGQFKKYEKFLNKNILRYEKSLMEQDNEKHKEVAYYEEQINFYETKLLPDFFQDRVLHLGFFLYDKAKIEYLKAEYARFLIDTKKEILTSHFRNSRTFEPNKLKVALLRHKLLFIFPNYSYFKHQMDEPTKAIVHFLNSKFFCLPENIEKLLTRKLNELKEFNEELFKKYYGDTSGWHVVIGKKSDEEDREHRIMTFLLLDEAKYGC